MDLLKVLQSFQYFRELLQIYSFSYCKNNETLKLTDLKPKLKTLIKNGVNLPNNS